MGNRVRLIFSGAMFLAVLALAACGGSADSGENDQALASLEQATEAARLQADVGELVEELAADPTDAELTKIRVRIPTLERRATALVAARSNGAVATDVAGGAKDTRIALAELALVSRDLSSGRASVAAHRALLHLDVAGLRLRRAVDAALASLEANGGLSDQQRRSVAHIRSNVVASNGDLQHSFAQLRGLIAQRRAAAAAALATAEAEAAAPEYEEVEEPVEESGSICPPGTELSPDGQLCSNGEPPR